MATKWAGGWAAEQLETAATTTTTTTTASGTADAMQPFPLLQHCYDAGEHASTDLPATNRSFMNISPACPLVSDSIHVSGRPVDLTDDERWRSGRDRSRTGVDHEVKLTSEHRRMGPTPRLILVNVEGLKPRRTASSRLGNENSGENVKGLLGQRLRA